MRCRFGEEEIERLVGHSVWASCLLSSPSVLDAVQLCSFHDFVWGIFASRFQKFSHPREFRSHLICRLLFENCFKVLCHLPLPVLVCDESVPTLHLLRLVLALFVCLPVAFGCSYCLCMVPPSSFPFVGCLGQFPTLSCLVCWDLA